MFSSLAAPFLGGLLFALAAGAVLLPALRRLKARQFISSDAPERHRTKAGTPTMGGLLLLAGALAVPLLLPAPGEPARRLAVLLATLGFGAVGFLDDLLIVLRGRNLGLRAREKLLGQFLVAGLFVGWFLAADPAAPSGPLRPLLALYYVLLIVGMSNAVNLTDGLDGLAAGVSLPVWLALAAAGLAGQGLFGPTNTDLGVVTFCAAFAGATLGYLWYNAHPAQVFMGDTGSLAIGGGMAAAAIALRQEWLLPLAGLVHVAEALSVTLQVVAFKTTGRRIFRMSPVHHHFELCGMPETRIVARFAIASALCATAALLLALRG